MTFQQLCTLLQLDCLISLMVIYEREVKDIFYCIFLIKSSSQTYSEVVSCRISKILVNSFKFLENIK